MLKTPLFAARTHRLVLAIFLSAQLSHESARGAGVPMEGQPPASGQEPGVQQEKDWVDNRWSRTDVGPFLASNLQLPGHRIAKGLSIKVTPQGDATMTYDTATCALRGAWTGGFLDFDPGRFGLIQSPRPHGTPLTFGPQGSGWQSASNHYHGLHLNGSRVVLEYSIDGVNVLEAPSLQVQGAARAFVRSFVLPPTSRELSLRIASGVKPSNPTARRPFVNESIAFEREGQTLLLALQGSPLELEQNATGEVVLHLSPSRESRRFQVALSGPGMTASAADLANLLKAAGTPEDLDKLLQPGPARWLPELDTVGTKGGGNELFAVDTLTVPYDNPWKALFFLAGVGFTPDGSAYVCTIHGDVWRVQGIDATLRSLRWKRFATGLFQPLGLQVRDGDVFVLGRDQITRLHDQNGDGEADYYENFCSQIQTSTGGHDYVTSLEQDAAGNFYYVDPKGVHRVSRDGKTHATLATGFRNPNGLGVNPEGSVITAAPQQGEWTPSSQLCAIRPGGYYGYGGPKTSADRPLGYDLPLCWIPHGVDNSSGSQVWVPRDQWGPLGGQMLHLLWGRCGMMLVLRDLVGGVSQGAVVPLPAKFLSGPNRGAFNSRDGSLYIAGSTGWQTSAVKDGALQRVRFLNKPHRLPVAWHAHRNGLQLSFALPLERTAVEDAGSYAVKQWNYRYARSYGSKDWSVADPEKEGRDDVPVRGAKLLPDGKSVFIELGDLKPVMQIEVRYSLNTEDGAALKNQLWLTLNALDAPR